MIQNRTKNQFGDTLFNDITNHTVMIVGVGGVGGYVVEALARFGIKHLILVDHDTVELSNINRQIVALHSTVNKQKVAVLKERVKDINPDILVTTYPVFYDATTKDMIFKEKIDFLVDAIDTITYKIDIVKSCLDNNIKFITVMGTGDKIAPEELKLVPLHQTQIDPIARVMRRKLKHHPQYKQIQTVCSFETPRALNKQGRTPTSNSFVPASAGLLAASYVIRSLQADTKDRRE
ncbi:MAG: ThiF family adenylyltransferase [Candidatus Izimaplasma sp.]|nr:ThiF family adenylyltransferase [Candidatus Izimaplasma bacterium]